MNEPDATLNALSTALVRLREQARPGAGGKQSSRAREAEQLALEVDDIIRRWSSELASPEPDDEEPEPGEEEPEAGEEEQEAGEEAEGIAEEEPE
jgi:hypothetical protein